MLLDLAEDFLESDYPTLTETQIWTLTWRRVGLPVDEEFGVLQWLRTPGERPDDVVGYLAKHATPAVRAVLKRLGIDRPPSWL